jgi:NADH-dependent peroxiredoxin subunit F
MLDQDTLNQLQNVFQRLKNQVHLIYDLSNHGKQSELLDLLTQVANTSTKVLLSSSGKPSEVPRFEVHRDRESSGIAFTGIPGGHEFTSLVLAILYADGEGKLPDGHMIRRIQALQGPVRLRTYVSLSCENCPAVVQALHLMSSLHPDFEHEMVDGAFVPEEVEALGIQGVPAVVHEGKILSSGRASMLELLTRLEAAFGNDEGATEALPADLGRYDVAVIGGGPAGASSAIYSARKGMKTVVICDRLGGQLQDTKGIENLISVPYIDGPRLSANMAEHLAAYGIEVLEHRRVKMVERLSAGVGILLESGETLEAHSVIVATGAKWRELGVPGEKTYLGRGVAFCPHCDGPYYKGKDIAVVGGGNSGVEAAIDLAGIVKSVTVLEFLPELKADSVLVDKLRSLSNVRVITHARTTEVVGDGEKAIGLAYEDRGSGAIQMLPIAGVFVQIGLIPNSGFLSGLVDTNRYGEIVIDEKGRTSQPGIYAAGDVTTVPYKQIVVAIGEGAKAGLSAFEDRMVA